MAGRMEAKIAALLSLLAVTLLAHALLLQPPRAAAVFADRLLPALRLDGRQLVELVNRRNMILLCHAILLLILRDAGLLAAPARRRGGSAATAASGGDDACCSEAQRRPKSIVEACRSSAADTNSAIGADGGRVKRELRREPGKATARVRRSKPFPTGAVETAYAAVQEINLTEDKIACLHCGPVADDERSRGGEEMARQETEPECVDDVDEMNRKFEEFIASTRRKMQLESRQLVKV